MNILKYAMALFMWHTQFHFAMALIFHKFSLPRAAMPPMLPACCFPYTYSIYMEVAHKECAAHTHTQFLFNAAFCGGAAWNKIDYAITR
jgi:hypothetical protein